MQKVWQAGRVQLIAFLHSFLDVLLRRAPACPDTAKLSNAYTDNQTYPASAELRFLPPYSPDFNPIEMAFSKLKAFLKKTAARTVDDLWEAIAKGVDTFTQVECHNYFAAAGYVRE